MIYKIISGFQMGADIAGIRVGIDLGIATGGMMPLGFKTRFGSRPKYSKYGAVEHPTSESYVPRTGWNVKNADATIRFAFDLNSAGELCTLKAIKKYDKPYIDIDLNDIVNGDQMYIFDVVEFFLKYDVQVLNVAGNCGHNKARAKVIYDMTRKHLRRYIEQYHESHPPKDVWGANDL